jgi:arylsulfatase A-like enzyme
MTEKPNLVVMFVDQLRASSLPLFGETQISTPHIDALALAGTTLTNSIAPCPVCTPSRAMLLTGRHPQTTGHIMNTVRTRHSEISIADAFANAGYRTGWVGKWHLHTGLCVFPAVDKWSHHPWVPEGRDRLGFQYWRAYNQHMDYFDGYVHGDNLEFERWEGYETDGLLNFGKKFIDAAGDDPFCLFLSPHQPHFTPYKFAPAHYYERLPDELTLPKNVPANLKAESLEMYRHYLAMILAVDDMLGNLVAHLTETGKLDDTILVFHSDHGTQGGGHGVVPWMKKYPYEDSIRVPTIIRFPGIMAAGVIRDTLTAMPDIFPSLCGLADIPVPRSVEGLDLSASWRGLDGASEQDAVLTMNFSAKYDMFEDGMDWRGVRTKTHSYAVWLDGRTVLYDLGNDPLQLNNLAGLPAATDLESELQAKMEDLQRRRGDQLLPCTQMQDWFDSQRRVVKNAFGPLGDPEAIPDWSLLSR